MIDMIILIFYLTKMSLLGLLLEFKHEPLNSRKLAAALVNFMKTNSVDDIRGSTARHVGSNDPRGSTARHVESFDSTLGDTLYIALKNNTGTLMGPVDTSNTVILITDYKLITFYFIGIRVGLNDHHRSTVGLSPDKIALMNSIICVATYECDSTTGNIIDKFHHIDGIRCYCGGVGLKPADDEVTFNAFLPKLAKSAMSITCDYADYM